MPSPPVSEFDLAALSDVSGLVQAGYGRTTLSGNDDQLATEFSVTNVGSQAILAPLVVVMGRFTELETTAFRPDGILPDGRPFFDLTSQMESGVLAPGQSVSSRAISFLNQSGRRFSYSLQTFGRVNSAPDRFVSTPITAIEAGRNYSYLSNAIDPDGQPLVCSKVFGPESMRVDQATGLVSWMTSQSSLGSHRITLRATDPYGLYVEQNFRIEVVESLQNRPPIFLTDPVTDAIASSGFEITIVSVGNAPAGVAVIGGFRGPRLVTANSGDQSIGVYAGENNDRFDDAKSFSTGFPEASSQLFDVGYSIDIGLPEFVRSGDWNAPLGMDQGDLNGDGILDMAVLYVYEQPSANVFGLMKVVVVYGDGDGGFSPAQTIFSLGGVNNVDHKRNLTVSDLDRDGDLDVIFLDRRSDPRVIVILNNGDRTFSAPIENRYSVALSDFRIADIDEDGLPDLIGRTATGLGLGANYTAVWLKGLGGGTYADPNVIAPAGSAANCCFSTLGRASSVLDFNQDGHLDLAILSSAGVTIYQSDGTGNFTQLSQIRPSGIATHHWVQGGDFNGDGFVDLVYNSNAVLYTMLGDGTGINFTVHTSGYADNWVDNYAGSDQAVDIDRDGDLDLIVTDSLNFWTSPKLAINDGSGRFTIVEYPMVDFSGNI